MRRRIAPSSTAAVPTPNAVLPLIGVGDPAQELPAIWCIFRASALNKLWLIARVLERLGPVGMVAILAAAGAWMQRLSSRSA